jgi:SAM-dependent methyltransferase
VGNIPDDRQRELESLRFDTIVCINVLEHVRDDAGALRRLAAMLAPGGALALLVPAHPALYGAYDRLDGHFRRYTRAGLRRLLEAAGLRVRRLHFLNAPGAVGWWVQYRLLRRAVHGPAQFGAMNRILPWVRALESRLHPPFGLSLVAVAERGAPDAPR